MKSLLTIGALLIALTIQQFPPPPPAPPPPPQRGGFPASAPAGQPAPLNAAECKCSIDVTVKRQSNGAPISDAEITISFNAPISRNAPAGALGGAFPSPQLVLTGKTDDAGRANFANLAEGTYSVTVRREGFFGPSINGNFPTSTFTSANVGPAAARDDGLALALATGAIARSGGTDSPANFVRQPVQHVAVNLVEGGIISGRILDANHRPAVGIPVSPMQTTYQYGQKILRQTANRVQTDDLGQYRLFWFAPGEYYVATGLTPAVAARGGVPNFPSPTYYPGTLELARARSILVHEGEEISGADFEVQSGGGVTISGTVTNTLPGRIIPQTGNVVRDVSSFFLVPRNSSVQEQIQGIPNVANGRGGARGGDATVFPFEIRGVPPGSYDFYSIFNDGATPRNNSYAGHTAIEVGSENISGIQSIIQPGVDLKIHVSVIGTPLAQPNNRPAQPVVMQNVRVQIRPVDSLPAQLSNGLLTLSAADNDANLLFTNIPEARLFVSSVSAIPLDGYVSDIRHGTRSIMEDTIFNIGKETPDPLEVVISRGGATISGTLEDAQHNPVTGTRVFLIPDMPRRRNLLLYKTTTSATKGVFNFQGVAPGIYRVFAFDTIPQGAEQNDEFMIRYDGSGTRVVASAGAPLTNVQVTLIQGAH
jgi:hypothetical protein